MRKIPLAQFTVIHEAIINAYEGGFDDGFYRGVEGCEFTTDALRHAYRRGYDRGVALYCQDLETDENLAEIEKGLPVGPCLCGRGECPECGNL